MRSDWVIMALFSYGLQGNIYGYGLNPGLVPLLAVRCLPCLSVVALAPALSLPGYCPASTHTSSASMTAPAHPETTGATHHRE